MKPELQKRFDAWLSDKNDLVKAAAQRFPPGTKFKIHETTVWVISYNDNGSIGITLTNPAIDYEVAVEFRQSVCACCIDKLDELRIKDERP